MTEQLAPAAPPTIQAKRVLAQPWTGLIGLVVVAAAFLLLGVASGAEHSLLVLGPITTFALPVLAMVALWWNVWPGSQTGRAAGGVVNTLIVALGALVLTGLGLALTGTLSVDQIFGTASATAPSVPTFPFAMPLAALVFVVFLQLTFVNRNWPFQKLGPIAGGLSALATSWVVGIVGARVLVNWDGFIAGNKIPAQAVAAMGLRNPHGPVDALQLIALVLCIVMWQMGVFFLLRGWPVSLVRSPARYLVVANAVTIVGGWATWLVLNSALGGADKAVPIIGAIAGVWVAGTLIAGLLFEGWPSRLVHHETGSRICLVGTALAVAIAIYYILMAIGHAATWTKAPVDLWVSISGLNFIGAVVITHVALWRRWPVASES